MDHIKIFFVVTILILAVHSKPYEKNIFHGYGIISKCKDIIDVDTVCQKCAKVTKSVVAYPMCCTDKEDAYRWCLRYINFGLQKRTGNPNWLKKNLTRVEQITELRKHLSDAEVDEWIRDNKVLHLKNFDDVLPDILTNMV